MAKKILPTTSQEQRLRGTIAHPDSLGKPRITLGTKGCGTGVRGISFTSVGARGFSQTHLQPSSPHIHKSPAALQFPATAVVLPLRCPQAWIHLSPRPWFGAFQEGAHGAGCSKLGQLLPGSTVCCSRGMSRSRSHGSCQGRKATTVPTKGTCLGGHNTAATRATATTFRLHPHPGHGKSLKVPAGTWP